MAGKTWVLTDLEEDVHLESLSLGPEDVGGQAQGYSVVKRTLHGGLRSGVDVVEVNNGRFRFVVVPTRGMGLWRASLGQVKLGWRSPVCGPVNPAFVRLWEPSGIGWLDGFDEWLCRCGLESNGAPEFDESGRLVFPLHGRIANTPARKVQVSVDGESGEIRVEGIVEEARLFGNKLRMHTTITTRVNQPGLVLTDVVTNAWQEPAELELLYHINFGVPLLEPGARVVLPVAKAAPRDKVAACDTAHWDVYDPETPGSIEAVFFFELAADREGNTRAVLRNRAGDQGVSLKFNKHELPYFTLWKNRQSAADGYVTGLEPAINFPNPKSFEKKQGRVAVLEPGGSRSFTIEVEVHENAQAVASAEQAVAQLQQAVVPEILDQPDPAWSAG